MQRLSWILLRRHFGKRKQLVSTLISRNGLTRERIAQVLLLSDFRKRRPQELSVDQWIEFHRACTAARCSATTQIITSIHAKSAF